MANKQIEMRKVKQIFKLYSEGISKRQISSRLGLSPNTLPIVSTMEITGPNMRTTQSSEMKELRIFETPRSCGTRLPRNGS